MILIDAGGGTSVALARAGADEAELDTILVTHLHPDHVSDLPDLLWGMSVEDRHRPLEILGPSGAGDFPGFRTFLARLFGSAGAFPFMKDLLDGREFPLQLDEVDATHGRWSEKVLRVGGLNVSAYAPIPLNLVVRQSTAQFTRNHSAR
jgi:ribonuclease BN (tRNA processing enzyme)